STTINPVADAQVKSDSPTTNYGSATTIRTREPSSGTIYRSYLKFSIPSSVGSVAALKLRLFVTDATKNLQGVYLVGDTSWNEATINWNNKPDISGAALATSTPSATNAYVEINLPTTGATPGNLITYGLKGVNIGTDSLIVNSRNATSNRPELVITAGPSGPPVAPVGAFAASPTDGTAPLTVTFTDQSTNGPTAWAWDFGDPDSGPSNTSTAQNPTHTYAAAGTYTATLTPSNGAGAGSPATRTITVNPPASGGGNVLVGAGDIADCNRTTDEATAVLLDGISGTVYTAGDNTYPDGTAASYATCYDSTWGRHKGRTKPAAGNHEYINGVATPYFDYFGAVAGDPDEGWYSFDVSGWHVVVLNSNCSILGGGTASAGCGPNSPQVAWLRSDLAASSASCTVAIFHHPRFTSRRSTPDGPYATLWTELYNAGAEIIINGHQHLYERFAPQTSAGTADPSFGIREFVVGTGGTALNTFGTTVMANSEVRRDDTHGVLKLTLHATSYDFQFVPVAGKTFTDSGVGTCHGRPSQATQLAAAEATALEVQRSNVLNDRRRRPH
ncbi:MAG TPA: DNRLRE domain-containing protein, partial [Candidatus Limnocylindrales bacterium]|nr:DNRLRE domain-containing protein [Candidatus Limnocylindrales bacterium]